MSRLFLRPKHGESKFFLFRWFNAALKWVENSYDAFLEFTAHHWWTVVIPSVVLLALTGWMLFDRPKSFIPNEDQSFYFSYGTSYDPSAENLSLSTKTALLDPEKDQTFEVGGKIVVLNGLLSGREGVSG